MELTSELTALGYIGVRSTRLADWGNHATGLLGMQAVDRVGPFGRSAWTIASNG